MPRTDYYTRFACKHLEVEPEQIVGSRLDEVEGVFIVLVDYGIGGVKKYRLSLAEIDADREAEAGADFIGQAVEGTQALGEMVVADLRKLAKDAGIEGYSGMKKADLVAALTDHLEGD